jgi:dihydrofolate synthase/folylpolyglutamate synthase
VTVKSDGVGAASTYLLELPGLYQQRNLLTVLATLDVLRERGWRIGEEAVQEGLRHTRRLTGLQGRWETLRTGPRVVLDVAHNEPGMRQVLLQLERTPHERLRIVIGMVRDKDVGSVLSLLPRDAEYFFTCADVPRALSAEELAAKAAEAGLTGSVHPDVNAALRLALDASDPDDLVLVVSGITLALGLALVYRSALRRVPVVLSIGAGVALVAAGILLWSFGADRVWLWQRRAA